MTEVHIKYNPYTVDTIIKIDGTEITSESKLYKYRKERLQVWLDQLIQNLLDEINEKSFKLTFHGTSPDFEDVRQLVEDANGTGRAKVELSHIKAKETGDIIKELKELVSFMQSGPIKDLTDETIKKNFDKVIDSEYEIAVIATMSSGKSTLINAFLGTNLLPSRNEACTAKITVIKNIAGYQGFKGRCFDQNNKEIEPLQEIDYETISRYNDDQRIHLILIEGNLPHISSRGMNLVLVDTPGPNYTLNNLHREHTFRVIKDGYKPLILYVLDGTKLQTDDDKNLLSVVAEQMKVAGKQSKDRFIFALNKMDCFDPEKENISDVPGSARSYLKEHGIENANVYPISAETAKVIRMHKNGQELSMMQRNILNKHDLFLESPDMHLTNYTPLSQTVKRRLGQEIAQAAERGDTETQALYHSGIPAVEAAINEYLEKYAITSKITSAVNFFRKIIEDKRFLENLKKQMLEDDEKRKFINDQMQLLEKKIKAGEKAKIFKTKIDNLQPQQYNDELRKIRGTFEEKLVELIVLFSRGKVKIGEAESILRKFCKDLNDLQGHIFTNMEKQITVILNQEAQKLMDEYKSYIEGLLEESGLIKFVPLKVIVPDPPNISELLKSSIFVEEEKTIEYIINTDKKWWKFWTWFDPDYLCQEIVKSQRYVFTDEVINGIISPCRENFYQNYNKQNIILKGQ